MSDLESLQKRLEKSNKKKLEKDELDFLEECKKSISEGKQPNELEKKYSKDLIKKSALLSLKPKIIVCNVDEKSLPEGNKFLSHVREVDAIIHLTRCFDSDKIQNVNKDVDPIRDLEIIETEILLSDLESLQKRLEKSNKKKLEKDELNLLGDCHKLISDGKNLDELKKKYSKDLIKKSALLSLKPRIIVCNVDEKSLPDGNKYSNNCKKKFSNENIIIVCADIEDQIMSLQAKDRKDFMFESGIKSTGLDNLIKTGYKTLDLSTFFTSGPEESRAWTIQNNSKASDAAGVIHSDFKKKFIRAETVTSDDFIKYKGFNECKNAGKLRLEGKDYVVNDGDVMYFRVGS